MQTTSTSAFSAKPSSSPATSLPGAAGRFETSLAQQLGEHGPGELVAFLPSWQAANTVGNCHCRHWWFLRRILLGHDIVASGLRREYRARAEIFDHVADALLDLVELLLVQCIQSRISLRRGDHWDENRIVERGQRIRFQVLLPRILVRRVHQP